MKTFLTFGLLVMMLATGCQRKSVTNVPPSSYLYNPDGKGPQISFEFIKGKSFNSPLFAIWVEDEKGNFLQTLYVSESIGKGIFQHGQTSEGKWMPGEIRRPAALPYWGHRRGIRAADGLYLPDPKNPIPDAYTGPTPPGDFKLVSNMDIANPGKFTIYFEINQTWDWNEYWTNNKYPDDEEYKTSCQPAIVYRADIDMGNLSPLYEMKIIGHSHYSGKTGELFSDLSTLTTALHIAQNIKITVK
jgi:hypothetical protein